MSKMLRLKDQAAYDELQRRLKPTARRYPEVAAPRDAALERGLKGLREARAATDWNETLFQQIRLAGLPLPDLEYEFAKPERKFRADLAWPARALLVEIDGAPHRIKGRFAGDVERDQWLFFSPWRKLRVTPAQVRSGLALSLVARALASTSTPAK